MHSHKIVWQQTGAVALGELLCCAVMVGVFALAGHFDASVVLGALAGFAIAVLNFFVMALCADIAADRGEHQDIKGGQALVQMSYLGRMVALFLVLVLCAKLEVFNLIALVVPLVFVRPVLTVSELIKKKGDDSQ